MIRIGIVFIVVATIASCTTLPPTSPVRTRHLTDTFAFEKLGKSVFLGANAILQSDSTLILVTNQDLFRSSNKGATWETLAEPLPHKNITAVLAHGDTIYAGSGHGTVYRSTDHGLNWSVTSRLAFKPVGGFTIYAEPRHKNVMTLASWPRPLTETEWLDSTIVQRHPAGVQRSITWDRAAAATALVANDTSIILATHDDALHVHNVNTAHTETIKLSLLKGRLISCLARVADTIYLGMKDHAGGVYRVILGTHVVEQMMADRIEDALEIQALSVNERGMYIASRQQGVMMIPSGSNIIRSVSDGVHLGLHQSVSNIGSSWVVSSRLKGALMFDANGRNLRLVSSGAPMSSEYVVTTVDSTIVMGLTDGTMYITTDKGYTWQYRSKSFEHSELTLLCSIGSMIYACTVNGLYVSLDSAKTFTIAVDALRGEDVRSLIHADSMMIVVTSSGTYTVTNGQKLALFSPAAKLERQARLNNAIVWRNVVFAVGYPGLFVSVDHGTTWELTTIPKVIVLRAVTCDGERLYVVAENGDVYVSPLPRWLRELSS